MACDVCLCVVPLALLKRCSCTYRAHVAALPGLAEACKLPGPGLGCSTSITCPAATTRHPLLISFKQTRWHLGTTWRRRLSYDLSNPTKHLLLPCPFCSPKQMTWRLRTTWRRRLSGSTSRPWARRRNGCLRSRWAFDHVPLLGLFFVGSTSVWR